jgi:DNA polymerase-3 subunit beta
MRLIDGAFPDYHQVLPKQKGTLVTLNRQEFTQALRRVALLVTDKAKCVKLEVGEKSLRISSSSPELGEATEEIACQYKGTPLSVGFNAKYLLDVASAQTSSDQLCMELHGELGPGKFYPENDESCVAIVMPMRL